MASKCKKFRCWSNLSGGYDLELESDTLSVNIKIPYPFRWIQIYDENHQKCYSRTFIAKTCRCHLHRLKRGKYYLFLLGSNNGVSYDVYIGGKQIVMDFDDDNEWSFRIPAYAQWNLQLIKSGKLEHVLCDTLLDNSRTMTNFVLKLTSGCTTTRDKVLVIHDFVASNLFYDYDALNAGEDTNRTVEQITATKRCVCQGYADVTLTMLQSLGLEAENVLCYAISNIFESGWSDVMNRTSELNHVVTRVNIEGKWLYMDVTWDSGNKYENGKFIRGKISHRYFDVTIAFLSTTHRFLKKGELI